LLTQYFSVDHIDRNAVGGPYSTYGEVYICIKGSGWKPEEKRPLGKPWLRWEDNIMMDLQEVGCEGMDRISVAQDGES